MYHKDLINILRLLQILFEPSILFIIRSMAYTSSKPTVFYNRGRGNSDFRLIFQLDISQTQQ